MEPSFRGKTENRLGFLFLTRNPEKLQNTYILDSGLKLKNIHFSIFFGMTCRIVALKTSPQPLDTPTAYA
ncbi:MAG: hypothetical protein HQK77_13575 [Desulfobacterales bacterium]|nr:hypothetical protein [Desulfobacterales bacterium]